MDPRKPRPGKSVIHRSLDDRLGGTAKLGIVEEAIVDERSARALVIARWQDEEKPVAFDAREVERVVRVPLVSRGPMLIYPRHLWNILRWPVSAVYASIKR
jgi:hypothetical protein